MPDTTPSVMIAKLLQFRLPDGTMAFSGCNGRQRWRLTKTNQPTGRKTARAVWALTVEAVPLPASTVTSPERRSRPKREPSPPRKPTKKAQEEAAAAALLRSIGRDPDGPLPSDAVPF